MLGVCWRAALSGLLFLSFAVSAAPSVRAEGASEQDAISAARELFGDALKDEEAHRFSEALGKFQRVRDFRDTASIEYRIATCDEALGRSASAYAAYRAAITLARGDSPVEADIVNAATARLEILTPHLARLTLIMAPSAAASPEVRIDGEPVSRDKLEGPIALDSGHHVITAAAHGFVPFQSAVALTPGAQVSLTITLGPSSASAPPSNEAAGQGAGAFRRTAGWAAVVGGGALLVTSAVLLVARQGDIVALRDHCPGGSCPPGSNESDLESVRGRALVEGPLAAVFGAVGAVAVGAGAFLVLGAPSRASPTAAGAGSVRVLPVVAWDRAGVSVRGWFR